jgi:hypothetical protein
MLRPAEFKTARESMGLPLWFMAEKLGVSPQRVTDFELPRRKTDIAAVHEDTVRELERTFALEVQRTAKLAQKAGTITRYATEAEYWKAHPKLEGWPMSSQGPLLSAVSDALEGAGVPAGAQRVTIEWA